MDHIIWSIKYVVLLITISIVSRYVAFYDCVGFVFKYHFAHIDVSRPEIKEKSK